MTEPPPSSSRRETVLGALAMAASALVVVTCSASRDAASPSALTPDPALAAQAEPSARQGASPEGHANRPEGHTNRPEGHTNQPEGQANQPEGQESSPGGHTDLQKRQTDPQKGQAAPGQEASAKVKAALPTAGAELARFHGALEALAAGRRGDHVRVVWLGDSHTAADLWSGGVRRAFQRRYGDGGPGFVHVGWGPPKYRHERARAEASGTWLVQPGNYARSSRFEDGVLGLGGVRLVPDEAGATASVELRDAADGAYRWELAYRLPTGSGLRLSAGQGKATALRGEGTGILHHEVRTEAAPHRIEIRSEGGRPHLLGVVAEASKPGVVVDTVGLNGARLSTFLAWEAEAWQGELARRKPDLVVLAFGTNESSDTAPEAERYERQVTQLVGRVRSAAPGADCLVITPVDRAGPEFAARLSQIRQGMERGAAAARCQVWSALEAMGGVGSMATWAAESPPRGGSDGVHLTARGYASLAEALARDLMPPPSSGGLPPGPKAP